MKEPQNPETPGKTIKMEPRWVSVGGLSLPAPQPGPSRGWRRGPCTAYRDFLQTPNAFPGSGSLVSRTPGEGEERKVTSSFAAVLIASDGDVNKILVRVRRFC